MTTRSLDERCGKVGQAGRPVLRQSERSACTTSTRAARNAGSRQQRRNHRRDHCALSEHTRDQMPRVTENASTP